jgi:hypothetical protein
MASVDQLADIRDQLSDYYSQVSAFLSNASNTVPSFEDYVNLLKYEDILTDALGNKNSSASFTTGALMDTVHFVLAIKREFAMRASTKSTYYVNSTQDIDNNILQLESWYGEYFNYMRGTSPLQALTR